MSKQMKFERREKLLLNQAYRGLKRNGFKEYSALEVIKRAVNECGNDLTIGWSGGKCSTIVLHMILKIKSDIKAIYNNTGIEFPENVEYVHELSKLWKVDLTVNKPEITFWEIVKEHGFPKMRALGGTISKNKNKPWTVKRDRRPVCCYHLKEKPRYKFYKKNDIKGDISGLRACESRVRAIHTGMRSQIYSIKRPRPMNIYMPIAFWTRDMCEKYLKDNEIPHNLVYDTQTRNGCWACTGYKGWKINMMKYNPRMYKLVQNMRGVMLMDDYIPNMLPCEMNK